MVKLTEKYLIYRISARKPFIVRRKNETDTQYLSRITHLYLQGQFIDHIAKIKVCHSVSVIYLQNNMLRTLDNIDSFPNLTHLYLQRNFLSKLEHLGSLKHLKKIYLGFNEILVLEGLAELGNVREIHIESQDLPVGETLLFEPLSVHSLQDTLQFLDVSNNNLTTLTDLRGLLCLEVLIADGNHLANLADVIDTLKEWPFLKRLSLSGNPVTDERCYRDSIIFASKTLEILDEKPVHENTRKFIEKLTERRKCMTTREDKDDRSNTPNEKFIKDTKSVTFGDDSTMDEHFIPPLPSATQCYHFPAWQLNPLGKNMELRRISKHSVTLRNTNKQMTDTWRTVKRTQRLGNER